MRPCDFTTALAYTLIDAYFPWPTFQSAVSEHHMGRCSNLDTAVLANIVILEQLFLFLEWRQKAYPRATILRFTAQEVRVPLYLREHLNTSLRTTLITSGLN